MIIANDESLSSELNTSNPMLRDKVFKIIFASTLDNPIRFGISIKLSPIPFPTTKSIIVPSKSS